MNQRVKSRLSNEAAYQGDIQIESWTIDVIPRSIHGSLRITLDFELAHSISTPGPQILRSLSLAMCLPKSHVVFYVVILGDLEALKWLLHSGQVSVCDYDSDGCSLLSVSLYLFFSACSVIIGQYAICYSKPEIVRYLISLGADVFAYERQPALLHLLIRDIRRSMLRMTPLHRYRWKVKRKFKVTVKCLKLMLEAGCNPYLPAMKILHLTILNF